jgi:hypothetical protein
MQVPCQVVKGTMSDKLEDILRQHLIYISGILALTIHSPCISILNNEQSYSPTDVTIEFTAHSKKDRRMNDLKNRYTAFMHLFVSVFIRLIMNRGTNGGTT